MPHLLRVAEVATGATEAVLHEWALEEGASYAVGDILATLETDKAVVDIEAEDDGVLVARLVPQGWHVEVGAPIALLAASDEPDVDVEAELARLGATAMSAGTGSTAPAASRTDGAGAAQQRRPAQPEDQNRDTLLHPDDAGTAQQRQPGQPQDQNSDALLHPDRVFASPLARRMAREGEIAVEDLVGTGPGGRIVKRDVRRALADRANQPQEGSGDVGTGAGRAAPRPHAAAAYVDVPHSGIRRATAARLAESKRTTPHFYLRASVRADELLILRARLATAGVKVSVNDLMVRAVALAHRQVPEMNVIWTPDAVRTFTAVDVAVAVATDRGLLTPVLRGVDAMPLPALAVASNDLVDRARSGTLRQHELEGGTITVTNLGMFGVEEFSAIINPPHAAILAVGAVRSEPVVSDGVLGVGSVMHLGLAVDHRPVDGNVAARWLQLLVQQLEEPLRLLV